MIFNLSLLEHAVMCRIIQGQGAHAVQEVWNVCNKVTLVVNAINLKGGTIDEKGLAFQIINC